MSFTSRARRVVVDHVPRITLEEENLQEEHIHDQIELNNDIVESARDLDSYDELDHDINEARNEITSLESIEKIILESYKYDHIEKTNSSIASILELNCRTIERKFGFKSDYTVSALSLENFKSDDPYNASKLALESIKDTIMNLWEKIKEGLKKAWEFIKGFWQKHLSSMGRLRKTITKCIRKVKGKSGAPKAGTEATVPGYVQKAFNFGDKITIGEIINVGHRHEEAITIGNKITKDLIETLKKANDSMKKETTDSSGEGDWSLFEILFKRDKKYEPVKGANDDKSNNREGYFMASEEKPLATAWWGGVRVSETDTHTTIELFQDNIKYEKDKEMSLEPGGKDDLVKALEKSLSLLDLNEQAASDFVKAGNDFNSALKNLNSTISNVKEGKETEEKKSGVNNEHVERDDSEVKENANSAEVTGKNIAKEFEIISKLIPKITSRISHLNVIYCKATVDFAYASIKNYG